MLAGVFRGSPELFRRASLLKCAEIIMLSEVIFSIMVLRIAYLNKINKPYTYIEAA
jgi:hypothetical protein